MIKLEDTLRYAACLLACAVAGVDGRLQEEEKQLLRTIINRELILDTKSFRYAHVLNQLIEGAGRLKPDYKWALAELKRNEKHLSSGMKERFVTLLEKVAAAFPPVTPEEKLLVDSIKQELQAIGEPRLQE